MNIREIYNVLLVRIGVRKVLPSTFIKKKIIRESNEEIILLPDSMILNCFGENLMGRKTVIAKLEQVAYNLASKGFYLMIFELYRSKNRQIQLRRTQEKALKQQFPKSSAQQIRQELNKRIAEDGGGHLTGGAVDLTICDKNGNLLDMGTLYLEFNASTPTCSKLLTAEQRMNRSLLLSVMNNVGFVNYPLEWWHFSYGDRMWAAYSNKPYAIYGYK